MKEDHYKVLLIVLQYVSIVTSGLLGILGLYKDFKIKKTGKLTQWGMIAGIVLACSLFLGIASKTIEIKIESDEENSNAYKARIAAEQTLVIAKNTERLANALKNVDISISLSIPFTAPVFNNYRSRLIALYPNDHGDLDFNNDQFTDLIKKNREWYQVAVDLINAEPMIVVFPKGVKVPKCIDSIKYTDTRPNNVIAFQVFMQNKTVYLPDQEQKFGVYHEGPVQPSQGPEVLSLLDFDDATIIVFMATGTSLEEQSKLQAKHGLDVYKTPAMQYTECLVDFSFKNKRRVFVSPLQRKSDKCCGYPYFVGHLSLKD